MTYKKIIRVVILLVIFMSYLTSAGCSKEKKTTITILAAASLTEVFTELEKGFEAQYEDVDLQFIFAGTSTLMTQIKEGIDADVFVSANETSMEELIGEGFVSSEDAQVFAQNQLVLMVSKASEYNIQELDDVLQEGVKIVIAEPSQPIGKYTEELLGLIEKDGRFAKNYKVLFYERIVSMENTVKGVCAKVEIGEADVGVVYTTDFTTVNKDSVYQIEIPSTCNKVATYELAVIKASQHQDLSTEFVAYVQGEEGKKYLLKYGFMIPKL